MKLNLVDIHNRMLAAQQKVNKSEDGHSINKNKLQDMNWKLGNLTTGKESIDS